MTRVPALRNPSRSYSRMARSFAAIASEMTALAVSSVNACRRASAPSALPDPRGASGSPTYSPQVHTSASSSSRANETKPRSRPPCVRTRYNRGSAASTRANQRSWSDGSMGSGVNMCSRTKSELRHRRIRALSVGSSARRSKSSVSIEAKQHLRDVDAIGHDGVGRYRHVRELRCIRTKSVHCCSDLI